LHSSVLDDLAPAGTELRLLTRPNHIGTYLMSTGEFTSLVTPWPDGHISTRNILRPGWAYISTFSTSGTFPGFGEVFAVSLDTPVLVPRFAHTHHAVNAGYESEPHGCVSPDGARVLWASEWSNSGGDGSTRDPRTKPDGADAAPPPRRKAPRDHGVSTGPGR
jgi:hypothetical protein